MDSRFNTCDIRFTQEQPDSNNKPSSSNIASAAEGVKAQGVVMGTTVSAASSFPKYTFPVPPPRGTGTSPLQGTLEGCPIQWMPFISYNPLPNAFGAPLCRGPAAMEMADERAMPGC